MPALVDTTHRHNNPSNQTGRWSAHIATLDRELVTEGTNCLT